MSESPGDIKSECLGGFVGIGILEDQHRTVMRDEPIARRLEVAGQDLGLADAIVGQEPIGGLGRRPVLAGHRQALADRPAHPFEQHAKPLAEPLVGERAAREFGVQPRLRSSHRHLAACESVPAKESHAIPPVQGD